MAASSGDDAVRILADAAKSEGLARDLLTNLVKDPKARKCILKKVINTVRKQKIPTTLISHSPSNSKRTRTSSVAATPKKVVFELSVTSPAKENRFNADPYDDCGDGPDEPVHEIHKTVKSAIKSGWEYVLGELGSDESEDEEEFRDCFKDVNATSGGQWLMNDDECWGERLVVEIHPKIIK